MKLHTDQLDERSLFCLGEEAAAMLAQRDFRGLANRFGYALAFGREPAEAVEIDFLSSQSVSLGTASSNNSSISVKYFQPNSTNLFAVVECTVPLDGRKMVRLELIVTNCGEERYMTLESICNST